MASYFSFLDWKNIGKHIGKGLRDILNPPVDTGPSKEERRSQRLRDVLKGFAYFDTFEELIDWKVGDVDPFQRANTLLVERSKGSRKVCAPGDCPPTTKTLLCHDYKGGYHDYESVRPSLMDAEMYSCEYLQFVDTFIYFSHKLVCVPPPTWTNLLHRNGVKVLGTFIVEPQTPDVERMLELANGEHVVAKQLAAMADIFGFDGWLLNVEKEFPKGIHGLTEKLTNFIKALKRYLGPGNQVIWYDALTANNELDYQNGLTLLDVEFAKAADALFTNYKWTEKHLINSKKVAEAAGIDTSSIYFGIDVWAQNTNMPGPPRITFPSKGGGGTNTGLAMRTLSSAGLSTAIFAPGWTYEHFPTTLDVNSCSEDTSIAKAVDRAMWDGATLPSNLHCNCEDKMLTHIGPPSRLSKASTGGHSPHHTLEYRSNPITKYAREAPAGSASFFYTDFQRAFHTVSSGTKIKIHSLLGSQTPLPHLTPTSMTESENRDKRSSQQYLFGRLKSESAGLDIYISSESIGELPDPPITNLRLHLFRLSMPTANGPFIRITYQTSPNILKAANSNTLHYGIYTTYNSDPTTTQYHPTTPQDHSTPSATTSQTIGLPMNSSHLTSIGIYLTPPAGHPLQPILTILSVSITPHLPHPSGYSITNINLIARGQSPNVQKRLAWDWKCADKARREAPWSQVTGPFSYFEILVNRKNVGRAYGMEFPIFEEDFDGKGGMEITVIGCLFKEGVRVPSTPEHIDTV